VFNNDSLGNATITYFENQQSVSLQTVESECDGMTIEWSTFYRSSPNVLIVIKM
jgi:hypothetical protein